MLRFFTLLFISITLSGCWVSEKELFVSKYILFRHDLPQEVLIYYNDEQYILNQIPELSEELNSPVYEGFGFDEIKLSALPFSPNTVIVQGLKADDQKYYYLLLGIAEIRSAEGARLQNFSLDQWNTELKNAANRGTSSALIASDLEFGVLHPDPNKPFDGSLSELRHLEIRPSISKNLQGKIFALSLDGMSEKRRRSIMITDEEKVKILAEQEAKKEAEREREVQARKDTRYERAINNRFLQNCNNAFVGLNGNPLAALVSRIERKGNFCVMDNGIVEFRIRMERIYDLRCGGDALSKTCKFSFSLFCQTESEFGNGFGGNAFCGLIETARQPVTMQVKDDGSNVQVLTFELAQP